MVNNVPQDKAFQSKGHHSTVLPEELGERWHIGIKQARDKITKTTKRLTCSSAMPLARQYKADRLFQTKRLTGMWYIDTMGGWVKLLDRNRYSQVFCNGTYFSEIYTTDKKAGGGQAMKTYVI